MNAAGEQTGGGDLDRRRLLAGLGAAAALGSLARGYPAVPVSSQDPRQDAEEPQLSPRAERALAQLVDGEVDLGLRLHRALAGTGASQNVLHAPLSIWTALAMLHAGARGAGREALAQLLGPVTGNGGATEGAGDNRRLAATPLREGMLALRSLLGAARADVTLATADALWLDAAFAAHPATQEDLRATFGAEAREVDFRGAPAEARVRINDWVNEHTGGKIEDLLPEGAVSVLTRFVLTDAVHFLGRWRSPFDPQATRDAHFRRPDGSTVSVPVMRLAETAPFSLGSFDAKGEARAPWPQGRGGTTWLELPYEGERLSFLVVMPDEVDQLPALERNLDAVTIRARVAALEARPMRLSMPKLSLGARHDLVAPLRALGLGAIFEAGAGHLVGFAEAQDSPEARDLHVTGAFHAATLDLDERGTEAAAATGVVVGVRSAPPFVAVDRAFLFFLRERRSGAVLFMGRVADPSKV